MDEHAHVSVVRANGRTTIMIAGVLDETSQRALEAAFAELDDLIELNLRGVKRINSYGIGMLMKHLSRVSRDHRIEFVECSEMIVDQFQMLDFALYGRIKSLFMRYYCSRCRREDVKLLDLEQDIRVRDDGEIMAPEYPCSCTGRLAADESLEFLADHLDERSA